METAPMVLEDTPGRFSRFMCEQFRDDATYASAFDWGDRTQSKLAEATRWIAGLLLLSSMLFAPQLWKALT